MSRSFLTGAPLYWANELRPAAKTNKQASAIFVKPFKNHVKLNPFITSKTKSQENFQKLDSGQNSFGAPQAIGAGFDRFLFLYRPLLPESRF